MSSLFGIGAGSGASGFYNGVATQSLRFNSANTAYLYRTNSSNANRKKFTWSGWLKKSVVFTSTGTNNQTYVLSGGASGSDPNDSALYFDAQAVGSLNKNRMSGYYYMGNSSSYGNYIDFSEETNRVFTDVSAWYHIVLAVDTTQSTESDRIKYYVNGTLQTSKTQYYGQVPQDMETSINNNVLQNIGRSINVGNSRTFDGYMAEVNFIDGFQYDPSYFGETKNGVWIAKKYTGSYGTNGYRLEFKQTGVGTGASNTIGADTSGNDNHWTSSGIVASDCNMPDSPENNFCTINSIRESTVYNGSVNLSEGNLQSVDAGTTYGLHWTSTFEMSTGKWYWEVLAHTMGGSHANIGICNSLHRGSTNGTGVFYGNDGKRNAVTYYTGTTTYGDSYTNGDIIGVAFDADNETVTFYKNNSSQGAVGSVLTTANGGYFASVGDGQNSTTYKYIANWGQDSSFAGNKTSQGNTDGNGKGDFYYAPPSGYLALCSSNLPDTTISPNQDTQADDHFNTLLYTGNGSNSHAITGVGFKPDWLWIKRRDGSNSHVLMDSSRGKGSNDSLRVLISNATDGEYDLNDHVRSLDSDGFTLDDDTDNTVATNNSSQTYVAWNWKAGGSTPTKTYKVVVVSDSGNKYRFRNSTDSATFAQSAVTLDLQEGGTYTFDLSDSSMSGHPFVFSLTSNGTHGGGYEYTTNVTKTGTAGSAGASISITVASGVATLYYYCSSHSNMGGQINTNTTFGSTNFDGSILSVEQRNTTAGFSIVTYTGTGASNATIGHGLGAVPKMLIVKNRSEAYNWKVYHAENTSAPETDYLVLDNSDATADSATHWNDTAPTSSVFSIGSSNALIKNTNTFLAYCFAEVEGYSKFGSYTGNGNADGTFVHTGFRPAWVLIKRTDTSGHDWMLVDNTREPFNPMDDTLFPSASTQELSGDASDHLSNGFKHRSTGASENASGGSYIYMAFAEAPFKYANAR